MSFEDCFYGFRPGRSVHQALEKLRRNPQCGYRTAKNIDSLLVQSSPGLPT